MLDLDAMKASVNVQYMRGILIFMLAILLICALQLILTNRELRPIRSIGKAMKLVKQGVWKTRIEIKGNDEIWTLARNYNDMADALEEWRELNRRQNEEKLLSVRQTADAQMHALQSQINAHFLCNTLNAINMSAVGQGNEEVSEMLRMLSNIMRYAYSRSFEEVTLGDEVRWVSQYLALQ
jgi:sensor histidine kinase YesM